MPNQFEKLEEMHRDMCRVAGALGDINDRFRAALEICAAGYISPPCTIAEGHMHLATEFQRRMNVAAAALADQ